MASIGDKISRIPCLTTDLVSKWNTVIKILSENHISKQIEIKPSIVEKYKGDLWGLFKNEVGLQDEYIYPTIRVNGYTSSSSYNGEKLRFDIISNNKLAMYYKLFTSKQNNS
jgi:hypothetical protein